MSSAETQLYTLFSHIFRCVKQHLESAMVILFYIKCEKYTNSYLDLLFPEKLRSFHECFKATFTFLFLGFHSNTTILEHI